MKILALGASNSTSSINRKLAQHAASLIEGAEVTSPDLADIHLPIYSPELEKEEGIPAAAQAFLDTIRAQDAVIISFAEHNGSYTAAFKNLLDWTSRIETGLWSNKPTVLLSTSPGARGGASVLAAATASFPHLGAKLVGAFSLPSFYDHFSDGKISDSALASKLNETVQTLTTGPSS